MSFTLMRVLLLPRLFSVEDCSFRCRLFDLPDCSLVGVSALCASLILLPDVSSIGAVFRELERFVPFELDCAVFTVDLSIKAILATSEISLISEMLRLLGRDL